MPVERKVRIYPVKEVKFKKGIEDYGMEDELYHDKVDILDLGGGIDFRLKEVSTFSLIKRTVKQHLNVRLPTKDIPFIPRWIATSPYTDSEYREMFKDDPRWEDNPQYKTLESRPYNLERTIDITEIEIDAYMVLDHVVLVRGPEDDLKVLFEKLKKKLPRAVRYKT